MQVKVGTVADVEDSWVESAVKGGLWFLAFCEEAAVLASISVLV